jgi:hypothetical protein
MNARQNPTIFPSRMSILKRLFLAQSIQSARLLSSRPYWVSPPLQPQANVAIYPPSFGSKEGDTLALKGWGNPIPTKDTLRTDTIILYAFGLTYKYCTCSTYGAMSPKGTINCTLLQVYYLTCIHVKYIRS